MKNTITNIVKASPLKKRIKLEMEDDEKTVDKLVELENRYANLLVVPEINKFRSETLDGNFFK